jgi:alginate O-acetyltransferase complex protein AlgI
VFFWIPTVRLRQVFLALANFGVLYTQIPHFTDWIALTSFVVSGYFVARQLQERPNRWLLTLYLVVLISVFLILKQYDFLRILLPTALFSHTLAVVGLSYMLFRQIHVAVDAMQGQIDGLSFWTYLNYQANLFGLLAGPIQRYQEFASDWDTLEPILTESYDIVAAYRRLFVGVIKVSIFSAACLAYYNYFAEAFLSDSYQPAWKAAVKFAFIFYLYPAYIYFNFSGYCDIVIAGASLLGIQMPENFNWPFLSRNLIDYWTRFHITLGLWIRDYIFTPMYKAIAAVLPQDAISMAFLCYFAAFFLAGVWHGSTWNFVIFGVMNGIGVSAAKLWENWIIRRSGRQGLRAYLQLRSIRVLAIVANIHYVCLTLFFFPSDLERSLKIFMGFVHAFA